MSREHRYLVEVRWTGNRRSGTSNYRAYDRAHEILGDGKLTIPASAEPALRGDGTRWNPEELLVAALSQCHMLWYLHLCAAAKLIVQSYVDRPDGTMLESDDGSGRFTRVTLRPAITIADRKRLDEARDLHEAAHRLCFIANSVNFPVAVEPSLE
jgi:organic hydroperoxide reductase OsmC/OhrA